MVKIAFLCVGEVAHYLGTGSKAEVVKRFHEKFEGTEILGIEVVK